MALLTWHSGRRGYPGFLNYILGSDGVSRGNVIPAMALVDGSGNDRSGGTASTASFSKTSNAMNVTGANATYRAVGLTYAAYATPTDMITISGSDTKTVIVTALSISPGATSTGPLTFYWIRRSAANTGGTSAAQTAVPVDSADSAATAVVRLYSAAPAGLGTAAGTIAAFIASASATTAAPATFGYSGSTSNGSPVTTSMVNDLRKPVILRGSAESLVLNFNGVALPAGFTAGWYVEWIEF